MDCLNSPKSLGLVEQLRMNGRGQRMQAIEEVAGGSIQKFVLDAEDTAGTGHFYTTTKNKRTTPDKMEIKKYDPRARKHVIYKETKIK